MPLRDLLERLENQLVQHSPGSALSLGSAATDEELASLGDELGLPVPPELREMLCWHNGQVDPYMSATLVENQYLLSVEWILKTRNTRLEVAKDLGYIDAAGEATRDPPWWEMSLIPLTDSDGSGYCIHAVTGEVKFFNRVEGLEERVAPDLQSWVEKMVLALESGSFDVEHGCIWFD